MHIYIRYIWFGLVWLLFLHVHTVKWFQVLLCISNNSIKNKSFVYTQLNDQTVQVLLIQFIISHLFAHSLMSDSSIGPLDKTQ